MNEEAMISHDITYTRKELQKMLKLQRTKPDPEPKSIPPKTLKRMADHLTTLLDNGSPLCNRQTGKTYSRREVRIIRDALDSIVLRNRMKNPLEALDTTEGD